MKKRISVAIILVMVMCLILSSCSINTGSLKVLKVGDAEIDSEIYFYYLDRVMSDPVSYSLDNPSPEKQQEVAVRQCAEYVAINTMFASAGLTLSTSEKKEIAESVNNMWIRFSNHYKGIGVSRKTLSKIETSDKCRSKYFSYRYDRGESNLIAESELLKYFSSNFIIFRSVCSYFYEDDGVTPLGETAKNEMIASFEGLASKLSGASDFSAAVSEAGYTASDISVVKKGSNAYPEGFFDAILSIPEGSAGCICFEENECVFVVYREKISDFTETYFPTYRNECLEDIFGDTFSSEVDREVSSYKIVVKEKALKLCEKLRDMSA